VAADDQKHPSPSRPELSSILERLAHNGSVDATELAKQFAVSPATIRRDLQMLDDQKLTHAQARRRGGRR
jgi:DeoR/GlpR family transcriptional regulator of sugar metabolism